MNSDTIYSRWQLYCKKILETNKINDFKNHPDIEYMLEHNNLVYYGQTFLQNILTSSKDILSIDTINNILSRNEFIGNSNKNVFRNDIIPCHGSSLRYLYMSLLFLNFIKDLNNIKIIEIGGGYGGFSSVFIELSKICGLNISEYILIDIDHVIDLQKEYHNNNNVGFNFKYINFKNISSLDLKSEDYILFSSYSLSEVSPSVRKQYYDTIFNNIRYGMIFWNTIDIDLDLTKFNYTEEEEIPKTGPYNRIIYFKNF